MYLIDRFPSINIDNRWQSIITKIFVIDWLSIININRLIDIDCHRLLSMVIDYPFHRLFTSCCNRNEPKQSISTAWRFKSCQTQTLKPRPNDRNTFNAKYYIYANSPGLSGSLPDY